ncbi:hypothetical protein [Devosia sp. RR2S18]|uniref:hypothetical protein n=1 Tax=Devosia rhizosphaerae TaxID=3049774 RepID=UPI00253FA5C9|nr:hypothetical protein [Devosia sp. RR2S18]WIJ24001.1 hypothetical protein QOV41_13310 [Devosia sp. RR2S18]
MASQFFHVSIYGRKARKGASRHETAQGMLNEAARVPSATGHLKSPVPPVHLYGQSLHAIGKKVQALGVLGRDCRGRRLRSDAGLLMCAVASYPVPLLQMEKDCSDYRRWKAYVVAWLQEQFGPHLSGVLEHQDETYGHVHAFVLPPVAEDGQLQWEIVHPGRRAKKAAAAAGASSRDQDAAYVVAMQSCQDSFHSSVSGHFGHVRLATLRDRRPRKEHLLIRSLEAENDRIARQVAELQTELAKQASIPAAPAPTRNAGQVVPEAQEEAGSSFDVDDTRDDHDAYASEVEAESANRIDFAEASDDLGLEEPEEAWDDHHDDSWEESLEAEFDDHSAHDRSEADG